MPRKYGITNAQVLSSPPATHMEGDLYWNLTQDKLYVSDGTQWVPVDTAQSEVALASSAPTPVANLPELWVDLAASDTSAIPVSSVWPAGDLAPFGAAASFPSTAGQPTYIDSAGKIRAAPQALWRDNPNITDPPETYPFGVTVMTISAAQASAGGWYSTGIVVTHRRYSDNPGICAQTFYANNTIAYNPRILYRVGNGSNTPVWQAWRGIYETGHTIPDAVDLNTYIIPGQYIQPMNASAANGSNYPSSWAGMLEVGAEDKTGGMVWQRYTQYGGIGAYGGATYQRQYYNGTWFPWMTVGYDSGWVDIAIQAGFTAQGTEKPQVRNLNGVIYSRGGWSGTGLTVSTTIDPVGTVPAGYRPTQNVLWRGGTGTGAALAQVFINNFGAVSIRMGPTATYVMLGGSWLTT